MAVFLTGATSLKFNATVCSFNNPIKTYVINSTRTCTRRPILHTSTCQVNAFNINVHAVGITAFACYRKVTPYTSFKYFFGGTTVTTGEPFFKAADKNLCIKIVHEKTDPELGRLVEIDDHSMATQARDDINYEWMTELEGVRITTILTKTSITYDMVQNEIYSPLTDLSHCSFKTGSCSTQTYTVIWNPQGHNLCTAVKNTQIAKATTMTSHLDAGGNSVNLEIKDLLMSFPSQTDVPSSLPSCFPKRDIIMTPQGILIEILNCSTETSTNFFKRKLKKRPMPQGEPLRSKTFTYMLNYVYDILAEKHRDNIEEQNLINCKNNKIRIELLKLAAKSQPSKILGLLLGRQVAATASNGVISQVPCRKIEAKLKNSLKVGNKFAYKPIAVTHNNLTIQKYEDELWIVGTPFTEQYQENKEILTPINNYWVTYINYSLSPTSNKPKVITPGQDHVNITTTPLDFSAVDVSNGKLVHNSQDSYLEAAATIGVSNANLGQLIIGEGEHPNIDVEGTPIKHLLFIKGNAIGIFYVIQGLGMLWSVIYPFLILYIAWQYYKENKKEKKSPYYQANRIYNDPKKRGRANM